MKAAMRAGCIGVLATALFSQGLAAQSLRDWEMQGHSEMRMTASITIPLGGRQGSAETRPRVDFAATSEHLRQPRDSHDLLFDHNYDDEPVRISRLSFTLERNPRLLINGQRVATFGPRLTADEDEDGGGLSTGEGILIGLGLVTGALVFATIETADEISDIVNPD